MIYLLDVNALVALILLDHEFHDRVIRWLRAERFPKLATCSITELGFLRVLSQASAYGFSISQAKLALLRLKQAHISGITFIADDHDISRLPAWVKSPKQTTDGHLSNLAKSHGAIFVTLHRKIPGALLIP